MIHADCSFLPDIGLPILHSIGGICDSFGMAATQERARWLVRRISPMLTLQSFSSSWATVRILAVGTVAAGAFACLAAGQLSADSTVVDLPLQVIRLQPHTRPVFALEVPESNAVELTGSIEFCQMPRQPRPLSAPPRRIDVLASSLMMHAE